MLKKDLIELCLLFLLSNEDMYGYKLLCRIHDAFPDTQESSIYALLRNLSKEGYTEQYAGEISEGPTRKYYRLTKIGNEKMEQLLLEWCHLRDTIAAMGIGVK